MAGKNRYGELHEVRIYVSELLLSVFAEAVLLSVTLLQINLKTPSDICLAVGKGG